MSPAARTITLTERRPHLCRLPPGDVAFLLARHRAHVEVAPTGRAHRYRLTATGHAGVIHAPTARLILQPKIPLRNVLFLLAPDVVPPSLPDRTEAVEGEALLDVLAGLLAQRLAERTAVGLHRGYAERNEQGPYLLGRLDVPAQMREAAGRKDQLHCRHDDFTPDVPCNQLPRAVVEALLASPLLGDGGRSALRTTLGMLESASSQPLTPDLVARAFRNAPPEYGPLLDLCRLLADGLAPGSAAGPTPGPTFLLDLERVFERHVTRGVVTAFADRPGWSVGAQQERLVNLPAPGQPDIHVRPDVTIERLGEPALVVDAKWKRLPRTALVTPDLYQVLAYGTALGARHVALVYAGRRRRFWEYVFPRSPIRVTVCALDVAGDRAACERALRRLGRDLLRLARSACHE